MQKPLKVIDFEYLVLDSWLFAVRTTAGAGSISTSADDNTGKSAGRHPYFEIKD